MRPGFQGVGPKMHVFRHFEALLLPLVTWNSLNRGWFLCFNLNESDMLIKLLMDCLRVFIFPSQPPSRTQWCPAPFPPVHQWWLSLTLNKLTPRGTHMFPSTKSHHNPLHPRSRNHGHVFCPIAMTLISTLTYYLSLPLLSLITSSTCIFSGAVGPTSLR